MSKGKGQIRSGQHRFLGGSLFPPVLLSSYKTLLVTEIKTNPMLTLASISLAVTPGQPLHSAADTPDVAQSFQKPEEPPLLRPLPECGAGPHVGTIAAPTLEPGQLRLRVAKPPA